MGKGAQVGKSHSYPSVRKKYSTSRKGIGGRKKKQNGITEAAKSTLLTNYFTRPSTSTETEENYTTTNIEEPSSSPPSSLVGPNNLEDENISSESEESEESINCDDDCDMQVLEESKDYESVSSFESSESSESSDSDVCDTNTTKDNLDNFKSVYDYRSFKVEKYIRDFPWLYYNFVDAGYKCKTCEMFPPLTSHGGKSKDKFITEAVKSLSDHPRRYLLTHEMSNKHMQATKQIENYKSQYTLMALDERNEKIAVRDSNITEAALIKLFKVTVFLVKNHWAHTYNFEKTVRFIGEDLGEQVFAEYLKLTGSHKNATYLSPNTAALFVKEVSEWMKLETVEKMRTYNDYTLLLDEATDESNRAELSLIARVLENGEVKNHFLALLHLHRCDAQTIFSSVQKFLQDEDISIRNVRFSGMDGCSTMSGVYNGVRSYFERSSGHLVYIHCRNHRLALCFAHLIPMYDDFKTFDGLLLNLFLLLKHSNVKSAIFEEVQQAYGIKSLKLIKAVVTRWLSHGKAVERVLDRYEALVAALESIYLRKKEPAVRGLRDQLIEPRMIATLCFLADVIKYTNALQTYMQGARLNWYQIPNELTKLKKALADKATNPRLPNSSYFGQLQKYLDIASKSAVGRFQTRSYTEFSVDSFVESFIQPVIRDLLKEIEEAFVVPEHLKGFAVFDPELIPQDVTLLDIYGAEGIQSLAQFYGSPATTRDGNESFEPIIDGVALTEEFKTFKKFVFKQRLKWETTQHSSLAMVQQQKEDIEKELDMMGPLLSETKKLKKKQKLSSLNREIAALEKNLKYTFDEMLRCWTSRSAAVRHPIITRMLSLAALIPPSTAEVERSFSLMNLISTPLRRRLGQESLGHCMRICLFQRKLTDGDYNVILKRWLKADDTVSKTRRVANRISYH